MIMKKSSNCFLTIIITLNLFNCNNTNGNDQQIAEALKFATDYSGTNSKKNWNDEYWDNACQFNSVEEYNNSVLLSRTPEVSYQNREDAWQWITDSLRLEYCEMRNNLR
jgi:hypothetical protein